MFDRRAASWDSCVRDLMWNRLLSEVQFYAGLDRAPDVLVMHAGGNVLGVRAARELLRDIKLDCLRLWASYPGNILVWSDIVARFGDRPGPYKVLVGPEQS